MLRWRARHTTLEALTGEGGEIAALPPDKLAAMYKTIFPEGTASDPKDQVREIAMLKYKKFDDTARRFALEDVTRLPGARLDAEWLGLKYRAAAILDTRADALDPKDAKTKGDRTRLQADAKKLATEVAKANADFAAEAREIAAKLGKVVAEGEKTFSLAMDEVKVSLATMQERLAEVKAAGSDATKSASAKAAAGTARDDSIAKLEEAMKLAGLANPLAADPSGDGALKDASIDDINYARYLLTYLLYDGQRYEESAGLGQMLVERYPNAKGSRQAAKIAMASWQQAAQLAEGKEDTKIFQAKEEHSDLFAVSQQRLVFFEKWFLPFFSALMPARALAIAFANNFATCGLISNEAITIFQNRSFRFFFPVSSETSR